MVAIGIVLLLAAYGMGLTGYGLIRGYDMTLGSYWNPVHPGRWNTAIYTGTSVFPDGTTQAKPGGAGTGPVKPKVPGKCPPGYLWDGSKCLQELG
ncbi:MAG TPA: hypothetical protein VGR98_12315 [Streptosporangiaceae bacterium]|nr:hypothetical protein [Streptosporangiaceae bacterium]